METYEQILKRMTEKYEERTGTSPDNASDIGIRMRVLAGEVFALQAEYEYVKRQMFPDTAEGEYLDRHAAQRGLSRRSAAKAQGEIRFYIDAAHDYDIVIPEGTVVSTRGENAQRYETLEEAVISSGRLAVTCMARALSGGADGNAAADEISIIVTPVDSLLKVVNEYMLTDGSDEETDEQLRRRVLDSFVNIPNGTNRAFYIQSALEVEGVHAAGASAGVRGAGTLDIYVCDDSGNASEELKRRVKNHLEVLREINVDIEVSELLPAAVDIYISVTVKSGYDFEDVTLNISQAVDEYFSVIRAGENFYLSDVGEYIEHAEGVENYTFQTIRCSDRDISDNRIATLGTLSITQRA